MNTLTKNPWFIPLSDENPHPYFIYVQTSEEELLKAVRRDGDENRETASNFKARRGTENIQHWKEKPLYSQFARQGEKLQEVRKAWSWLKEGKLKRETEALIIAAQDQAIRTNYIKTMVDKSQNDPQCRICKQSNETISHIVSSCSKLAQKEC